MFVLLCLGMVSVGEQIHVSPGCFCLLFFPVNLHSIRIHIVQTYPSLVSTRSLYSDKHFVHYIYICFKLHSESANAGHVTSNGVIEQ